MMKAIRVTKENKNKLEAQFEMDEDYLELSSGLYLVAGDGNSQIEGLLKPSQLTEHYFRTGRKLANEWFELMPKAGVQTSPLFSDA
jgi:hypothetical protein